MIDFSTFKFLYPAWLLLLPVLWGLLWWLARNNLRQSMWNRVCDPHLLESMQRGDSDAGTGLISSLIWPLAIVLTLTTIAAAGPSWRLQTHPVMESASARVIALDLSSSMLVTDIRPNRLVQAIAAAREIISSRFEGETGLLVFSGAAFVLSPLSRDKNTLMAFIDALEPGILPLDGTRIDLAIGRAQDLLLASITGKGQIIVITSGNQESSSALQAARVAASRGHQVSILAIGTAAGGPLIDSNGALIKDNQGRSVLAKTKFAQLQDIAEAGSGLMLSLTEATAYDETLGSKIRANNLVEASNSTADLDREAANDGIWLVWMILPFALLLFRRNLIWVLVLAIPFPFDNNLYAAEHDSIWQHRERKAFVAYQRQDFKRSAKMSSNPLLKGAAYYKSGDYQRALEEFRLNDSARSHYNRGNSLTQLNQLQDAIVAYSRALSLEPSLSEARYNKRLLELFLARQKEREGEESTESEDDGGILVPQEQSGSKSAAGKVGQTSNNPGDEQQLESGFGAALQFGQLDPFEQFDGRERQIERFSVLGSVNPEQAEILLNNWIENLPSASSELFRRKFQRDYQRQRQQSR